MPHLDRTAGRPMPEVDIADLAHGLERFESDFAHPRTVAVSLLLPGTVVTMHTRNTRYRMSVVNGAERRVLITGGRLFPEPIEVELVGARDDDEVKTGWIVEGLPLEMTTVVGPVITSMVETVSVEHTAKSS